MADVRADLTALMQGCGQALYEDREWNAPVYRDGKVTGASGANPCEAAIALDAVAGLLGIPGPSDVYNRLCEGDAQ
jgi:hypothetical protein